MDIKDIKLGNGILDKIVQKYNIIGTVDKERVKVKVNTNIGEQIKIVHKSQFNTDDNQLELNFN